MFSYSRELIKYSIIIDQVFYFIGYDFKKIIIQLHSKLILIVTKILNESLWIN